MLITAISHAQLNGKTISWRIAGELPSDHKGESAKGLAGPVTGAHHRMIIIGGGANFPDSMPWQGGKKKYYQQVFVFRVTDKKFVPVDGSFRLPEPVAYAATCTTPLGVFYAGGENENGVSRKAYLLQWDRQKKDLKCKELPLLPDGLTNAACAAWGNHVYIAGGENGKEVVASCWSIDLDNISAGWKEWPSLPHPVSHAGLAVIQNKTTSAIFLLGGRRKIPESISELYQSVYRLDLNNRTWTAMPDLPYPLSAGTCIYVGDDNIYLFGGERGTVFSKVEACLVAISKESRQSEREKLVEQKNQLLRTHPGFSREVICYNTNIGSYKISGLIPYPTPVTTTAFWYRNAVIIPSGEIRAGVRSPQLLLAKIPREK